MSTNILTWNSRQPWSTFMTYTNLDMCVPFAFMYFSGSRVIITVAVIGTSHGAPDTAL